MDVALAGASGLIGTALAVRLQEAGLRVLRLVRPGSPDAADTIAWDPGAGSIDGAALEGIGAVVNLAGRGIGPGRWTAAYKADVLESRIRSTSLLATTLAGLGNPPKVLVNASAVGFYGNGGDAVLNEQSPAGSGFLADVCRQWEAATRPAEEAGVRCAHIRTGIVLAREGGALGRMLDLFKLGLGGRIGDGKQWWAWITLADEVDGIRHIIDTDGEAGPFNLTAPNPVTNAEFTTVLARVLHRPAILAAPKLMLRATLGEFADEVLFASQRAEPTRLLESGYKFHDTELEPALTALLA